MGLWSQESSSRKRKDVEEGVELEQESAESDDKYNKPTELRNHPGFGNVKYKLGVALVLIFLVVVMCLFMCVAYGNTRTRYIIANTLWFHFMIGMVLLVLLTFVDRGSVSTIYHQFLLCLLLGIVIGECRTTVSDFLFSWASPDGL